MKATLYVIPGPWKGRLAILPRPRGGDWLEDEIRAWSAAGVDVVVSALEAEETSELELDQEREASRSQRMEFIALPIPDRGVSSSSKDFAEAVRTLEVWLNEGKTVSVHCRQGVGRSALIAASLLVMAGIDVEEALERIATARGCPVPDTVEQRKWVERFAREIAAAAAISK
jgi:protein-tyrosine phosphatase